MDPERTPHSLLLGATCLSARCTPRGARAYTSRTDTSLFFKPPGGKRNEAARLTRHARRKFNQTTPSAVPRVAPSVGDVASFPIENGTFGAAGDPLTEGSPPDTVDGGRIGCIGGADCLGRWSLTR
jgi:hypothetical protein